MGETTISNRKLLLRRLHDLHDYIRFLGIHVNQLYIRLEQIENKINERKTDHKALIEANRTELWNVKHIMVTIREVNILLKELNSSIMGLLPPLPKSKSKKEEPPLKEKHEEKDNDNNIRQHVDWNDVEIVEKEEDLETEEKDKKTIFSFIPRFRVVVHKRKK